MNVGRRHVDGFLRHVDGGDAGSASLGGIEGKGSGMGKAVEDMLSSSDLSHGQAVVFLVQEEPRLLTVFDVDVIADAIFFDGRYDACLLYTSRCV